MINLKYMKGCYLLQRNFAPVGHAIAYVFSKKYNVAEHCAYVSVRKNYDFLTRQSDVNYTALLLDEDVFAQYKFEELDLAYLKWLEKEFGIPNLWPYLTIDRILLHGQFLRMYPYDQPLFKHEDLLKILQITAKKIIAFLDTEKPDFVFFPTVGSLATFLLYEIARKKGIPAFMGEFPRIKNLYTITENPRQFPSLHEQFIKIRNKEILLTPAEIEQAKSIMLSFGEKPADQTATPDFQPINRRRQMKFLTPVRFYRSIYFFFKTLTDYYFGGQKNDYMQINPWFYFLDRLQKKIRVLIGYDDLYDAAADNEDFAYYSLSLEPELNLLFYSPFASDQINNIKQLARALPVHFKLYVKEHPHMYGDRTRKFYKEIKKMPNVKLINPKIKSIDIIKMAKLVATVNGTAGWEAAFFKKPAITFGAAFYNPLSMVKYCTSMHELADIVKHQLENFHYDEQELLDFIAALLADSAEVDILRLWKYNDQDADIKKMAPRVEPLVDLIAKKLNLTAVPKIDWNIL